VTSALVVGYGSIGQRHARVLKELKCEVAVVSRRPTEHEHSFATIAAAMRAFSPDYVVVANETSAHVATVEELRTEGFKGRVLIEKPLGGAVTVGDFAKVGVGYNLRFHPVLAALHDELAGANIVTMQIYCGQHLSNWRPGTDYRASYSADPERGGGVLRDLSHELDYLLWLAGDWRRVAAVGGKRSDLEIASDDCWGLLLELERCPCATVQINYLDRPGKRQIIVNTANHTYTADLIRGVLERDGDARKFEIPRDELYANEHRAMLGDTPSQICSIAEGERVMMLIAAAEQAARQGAWIAA